MKGYTRGMSHRRACLAVLYVTLLVAPLAGVTGCRTATPPPALVAPPNAEAQAYANANNAIMTEFGATLKKIAARPIPKPPKTLTKRERLDVYADELNLITVAAQAALTRLDRLTPPPVMQETHTATRDVVLTFRDSNAAYVAAFRRDDQKQADLLGAKVETDTRAAYARLRKVLQAALIREGKTPQEAEAMTANVVL